MVYELMGRMGRMGRLASFETKLVDTSVDCRCRVLFKVKMETMDMEAFHDLNALLNILLSLGKLSSLPTKPSPRRQRIPMIHTR